MIICFCGAAGSGKTTAAQKLSKQKNFILYSYDEFKRGSKAQELKYMRARMYRSIISELQKNNKVIIDDLNVTKKQRMTVLKALEAIPCEKILIVINTSLEECLYRNRKRSLPAKLPDNIIIDIYNLYEPPTLDEGWDKIIYMEV